VGETLVNFSAERTREAQNDGKLAKPRSIRLIVKLKNSPFWGCFVCGHKESLRVKESVGRMYFLRRFSGC